MKDVGWIVIDIPYPYLNYTLWVGESFSDGATLTAQADDPDKDGLSNIEEYFFGGDPELPSTAALPVMKQGSPDLELSYTRSRLPTDLEYAYEVSTDLGLWADAVEGVDYSVETVTQLNASTETVALSVSSPPGGSERFLRIRIHTP